VETIQKNGISIASASSVIAMYRTVSLIIFTSKPSAISFQQSAIFLSFADR
jgi:hypothetical protein